MQANCPRHEPGVGTCSSQESALGKSAWLISIVVVLLLVGCGLTKHPSGAASVSPMPNSAATTVAAQHGPVTIQVVVLTQQGTLAAGNVAVTAHVIVTNHTTRPIWLWDQCPTPTILMTLTLATTPNHTIAFGPLDNCILGAGSSPNQNVDPGLAAGRSQGYLEGVSGLRHYATQWPAGTYLLGASITLWHQGTVEQATAPGSTFLSGSAEGQTLISLS
jgi:hypothetical protein